MGLKPQAWRCIREVCCRMCIQATGPSPPRRLDGGVCIGYRVKEGLSFWCPDTLFLKGTPEKSPGVTRQWATCLLGTLTTGLWHVLLACASGTWSNSQEGTSPPVSLSNKHGRNVMSSFERTSGERA